MDSYFFSHTITICINKEEFIRVSREWNTIGFPSKKRYCLGEDPPALLPIPPESKIADVINFFREKDRALKSFVLSDIF